MSELRANARKFPYCSNSIEMYQFWCCKCQCGQELRLNYAWKSIRNPFLSTLDASHQSLLFLIYSYNLSSKASSFYCLPSSSCYMCIRFHRPPGKRRFLLSSLSAFPITFFSLWESLTHTVSKALSSYLRLNRAPFNRQATSGLYSIHELLICMIHSMCDRHDTLDNSMSYSWLIGAIQRLSHNFMVH